MSVESGLRKSEVASMMGYRNFKILRACLLIKNQSFMEELTTLKDNCIIYDKRRKTLTKRELKLIDKYFNLY